MRRKKLTIVREGINEEGEMKTKGVGKEEKGGGGKQNTNRIRNYPPGERDCSGCKTVGRNVNSVCAETRV